MVVGTGQVVQFGRIVKQQIDNLMNLTQPYNKKYSIIIYALNKTNQ